MAATSSSAQFDLGHWVLRIIALIIDAVVLGVIALILFLVLLIPLVFVGALGAFFAFWGWVLVYPFVVGLIMVLYFLVLDVAWQGTLGKRVLGLRVQTVNGSRISYSQSFIRNVSKIFWLFLLLDWLIGIATPGDRRQKYSDRVAGVTVVQVSQAFASVLSPASSSSQ